MSSYRVVSLAADVAATIRATGISPFAEHPTHAETARGYGPCRVCLEKFQIGVDRRVLLTYDPFDGLETYPLPGPVFIHESDCQPYPADGGFPRSMRSHRLTLIAYGEDAIIKAQTRVVNGDPEPVVVDLLSRKDVKYLHVRDTDAGCYDFRIERDAGD